MNKNNPKIKENISLQDEIDTTEMIADMFFRNETDEDGNIETKYTPYLKKVGQINAIVRYFLEGIEFEKNEDVYDIVMSDDDIRPLVDKFIIENKEMTASFTKEQRIMSRIMNNVYDIIEFKKANIIAHSQNETNSILAYKILELIETEQEKNNKEIEVTENLNAWLNEQRELNSLITPEMQRDFAQNFDLNTLTEAIYNKISESDLHKRNQEVIHLSLENREKDNKIIELQNAFAREKQKENVKNVLAD